MKTRTDRHPSPVDLGSVNVSGQLDARIGLGLNHLLAVRDRILSGEGHTQTWGEVRLNQSTTYPSEPVTRLELQPEEEISFGLSIRVPHWTPSRVRNVPYEVRNDTWILDHAQTGNYLARVQALLGSFTRERSGDTI